MIEFEDLFPKEESEPDITFSSEDIEFSLADESLTKSWIWDSIQAEGHTAGTLTFIFCSDDYLYDLNVQYLNHDTLTDVITFPYSEEIVSGDIFISIERVRENARSLKLPFIHELHRVMIHGTLHLMGYTDDNPDSKANMRDREDLFLARHPALNLPG